MTDGSRRAGRVATSERWATGAGVLTARDLEEACRVRGVRLDRARRTYWQSERVFPQPERRALRPPAGRGGARGYYHPGAVDLASLIDYVVRSDHPAKAGAWRCSARDLAPVLTGWRADADEDAFYTRVAGLMPLIRAGGPIPGVVPRHRDVFPPGQGRVAERERDAALGTTARVAEAIVDGWLVENGAGPVPERLIVWLRLERTGPRNWRIADAGARPTRRGRR